MDADKQPDTLEVFATHEEELAANAADLVVTVKGSSLVTGAAALTKAREVAALVEDLIKVGMPQKDIFLEDVSAEVSNGLLSRSSSATYRLRIRCQKLELLADVLGAITSQKSTQLGGLDWRYGDEEVLKDQWLAQCARRAKERAKAIAEAFGVRLIGVRSFTEVQDHGHDRPGSYGGGSDLAGMRSKARGGAPMSAEDLGLAIAHTRKVKTTVRVEYRVSALSP